MISHAISRRGLLALPLLAAMSETRVLAQGKAAVVVELFTSQGCSSCPPADALLNDLRRLPGVLTLAYHVDYWDYLGWKDTLASSSNSQRQYDYAKSRGDMDVYTPQIVVDGKHHVVGSARQSVMNAISEARAKPAVAPLKISESGMELVIEIGAGPATGEATLWVMGVLPSQSVKVMKGENAGRSIIYSRTVREAMPAGMWSGSAFTARLPKSGVLAGGCQACVALLQKGKVGPVLGAAQWGDADA